MRNGKRKMANEVSRPKGRPGSILHSPFSILYFPRGFTLIEMLTVLGIIALLLAITIPGITGVWNERKHAQAVTLVRGLLMSTRARAMRTSEQGLFFYLDPVTGAQRIAPIVADPPTDRDPATSGYQEIDYALSTPTVTVYVPMSDAMAVHRFIVSEGDIYTLPAPIRVVSRDVVDTYPPPPAAPIPFWPETDINWNNYSQANTSPTSTTSAKLYRHRNFFAMVFGPDGKLMVGRDVLIHDSDALPVKPSTPQGDNRGDRSGLFVEQAGKYYLSTIPLASPPSANVDPTGGGGKLFDMVVDTSGSTQSARGTDTALNLPSVDGLLVYDESVLRDIPEDTATPSGLGTEGKRGYLIREGKPIYVSRLTGEVIEGPKNE